MWEFFINNSPLIFIVYILIKDVPGLVRSVLDILIPARVERIKNRDKRDAEATARADDIRERQTIVMEQLVKWDIIHGERLSEINKSLDALLYSQTTVNTSLSVLLDRDRRYRANDETQPVKTIKRPEQKPINS